MSDDIMYDSKEDCYMFSEERLAEFEKARAERDELKAELERVKSRLPVNADGDVVLWGDTNFIFENGIVMDIQADKIIPYGGDWMIESDDGQTAYLEDCHSTAESCSAANTQEG